MTPPHLAKLAKTDTAKNIRTAMIFTAGLGTRMRPLTETIPKPLVNVSGLSLLDFRLLKLAEAGIEHVVMNLHYLPEQIEAHVAKRNYPLNIEFSYEEELLETAGGLVNARSLIGDDPVLILNGDMIWLDNSEPAITRLLRAWDAETMKMLMLLQPTERAVGYKGQGDFTLLEDGTLDRPNAPTQPYIYAGIQVFDPQLLDGQKIRSFSLSTLFKRALDSNRVGGKELFGIVHDGEWLHVDSPESLAVANNHLANHDGYQAYSSRIISSSSVG